MRALCRAIENHPLTEVSDSCRFGNISPAAFARLILHAKLDGSFRRAAESGIGCHAVKFANRDRRQGMRVKLVARRSAGTVELALLALHLQKRIPTFFHDLAVFARDVRVAIALKRQQRHGGGGGGIVRRSAVGVRAAQDSRSRRCAGLRLSHSSARCTASCVVALPPNAFSSTTFIPFSRPVSAKPMGTSGIAPL